MSAPARPGGPHRYYSSSSSYTGLAPRVTRISTLCVSTAILNKMRQFCAKSVPKPPNFVMISMLELGNSPRITHGQRRPFGKTFLVLILTVSQLLAEIVQFSYEHRPRKHPKIEVKFRTVWPAKHPCAGITLRDQPFRSLLCESFLRSGRCFCRVFQHCASAQRF